MFKGIGLKHQWVRWAGTALSVVLFAWLLARQNWEHVVVNLLRLPLWLLPLALLLYVSGMVLNAVRWYILLQAPQIKVSFWEILKIVFLGAFVSNFLPSTVGGDAVRVISLLRFTTNRTVGLASVVLDRIINMGAMFTVLPFSVATFGSPLLLLNKISISPGLTISLAISEDEAHLPKSLPGKLLHWFQRGRRAFRVWLHNPGTVFLAFVVSWLSVFVIFLAIFLLALGLGIPVALYQVMGVTAITYLLTLLPISVDGYGLREVAITTLYIRLGATIEQASTLAMITRFFMLIETIPGALWLSNTVSATILSNTEQPE